MRVSKTITLEIELLLELEKLSNRKGVSINTVTEQLLFEGVQRENDKIERLPE